VNKSRLMSGIILVTLGLIFLIANLGIISWSFLLNIVYLWPLVLIVIGINIVFSKNYIVRVVTWLLLIVALLGYSIVYDNNNFINGPNNSNHIPLGNAIVKEDSIVTGELELKLGGTELGISAGNSENLVDISSGDNLYYEVENTDNNTHAEVEIENSTKELLGKKGASRKIDLSLNNDVLWKIDAKIGAMSGNFDFSEIPLQELNVEVGAVDLDIQFGDIVSDVSAEIKAGASNITLHIPNSTGAKISSSSVLSNTNLNSLGWTKLGNEYISPNFETAENKISIDVKMGMGNMEVSYNK